MRFSFLGAVNGKSSSDDKTPRVTNFAIRRSYGISWSASQEVATAYAKTGLCRSCEAGSVVLKTLAEPKAIICQIPQGDDRYREEEYLVDRRRLRKVIRLQHFSHIPAGEREVEGVTVVDAAEDK
jgi:hypothetical protein